MTELELAKAAAKALDSKKALNLKILHITELSVIADYFVIATGTSNTQVKAMADEVEGKRHCPRSYRGLQFQFLDPAGLWQRGSPRFYHRVPQFL